MPDTPAPWFKEGLGFECVGCGNCCRNHSEYEYVYVTEADVEAICRHLKIPIEEFLNEYCVFEDGMVSLIHGETDCPFLTDNKCQIYPVRPKQCETWPFWTENLSKDRWNGPVKDCCPGIGRGKLTDPKDVLRIAASRDDWYSVFTNSDWKNIGRPKVGEGSGSTVDQEITGNSRIK